MTFSNKIVRTSLIGGLIMIFWVISCDFADHLERQPLDQISDASVWTDENLIEAYVNQTYRELTNGFSNPIERWFQALSDETYRRGFSSYDIIVRGEMTPDNMSGIDYWEEYYNTITSVNIFFHNVGEEGTIDSVNESVLDRMRGEMKFLRAYAYFNLISLHGGVPLITEPFQLIDDFNVARSSYEEVMEFVISEIDEAAELLHLEYDTANMGRITRGAALALKSRALLYYASPLNNPTNDQQRWQDAADAAKAVIDLGLYSLYPDYKQLFLEPFNEEIIWQRRVNNQIEFESRIELRWYPNGPGYHGHGQLHPWHNLVADFETINGLHVEDDPEYDNQNPYADRDPRFYATILFNGADFKHRQVETFIAAPDEDVNPGRDGVESFSSRWNATTTGYYVRKFIDESITTPTTTNTGNTPWTFIRYAEILLNYAEAMYELGDEATSREYLNMVRSRPSVEMTNVSDSGEALRERIFNERRIELVFENHRWFDVRRWRIAMETENKPGLRMHVEKYEDGSETYEVREHTLPRRFEEHHHLVPIPQYEIDRNPLLEQNPGYN